MKAWDQKLAEEYSLRMVDRLLSDSNFASRIGLVADANNRTLYQEVAEQSFRMAEAMVDRSFVSVGEKPEPRPWLDVPTRKP